MHYSYYDPRYPIRWATQGDQLYLVHKGHKVRMYPSGERSWRGRIDRKDYYDFFGKLCFDQNMSAEARYLIRASYKKEKAFAEIKKVQKVLSKTENYLKTAAFVLESQKKINQAKSLKNAAEHLNKINQPLAKNISRLDDLILFQKAMNHLLELDKIDQQMLERHPLRAAGIWDDCLKTTGELFRRTKIPLIKDYGDLLYSNRTLFQDNVRNLHHSFHRLEQMGKEDVTVREIYKSIYGN